MVSLQDRLRARVAAVVTTIQAPTPSLMRWQDLAEASDGAVSVVVVGDKKTPNHPFRSSTTFLSIDRQMASHSELARSLPRNHYARKNLGYIQALGSAVEYVYDTDDDNQPMEGWAFPGFEGVFRRLEASAGDSPVFSNVYRHFTRRHIWPRGFPLELVRAEELAIEGRAGSSVAVWQGLADGDPDVDAIYRLVLQDDLGITFDKSEAVVLGRDVYCPFNSQNTLWRRDMMQYAYLPATVSFRCTDILRGYIAQRCFWEHERYLGFSMANVVQERNPHDYLADFSSEIPCYLSVSKIVNVLGGLELSDNPSANLRSCYTELCQAGVVQELELELVDMWLAEITEVI